MTVYLNTTSDMFEGIRLTLGLAGDVGRLRLGLPGERACGRARNIVRCREESQEIWGHFMGIFCQITGS